MKLRAFGDTLQEAWVLGQRFEWDWGEQELRALLPGPERTA